MFKLSSEQELLNAFRPRDRKVFELPQGVSYPLIVRGTFSWIEPAGARVHVIFQDPGTRRPLGLSFRRDVSEVQGQGRMCDWCHAYGSAEQIGLLMCEKSSKRRVGAWLCRDLKCHDRIEQAADRAGRLPRELQDQLLMRMWRFAREGLGIEMVPAD